MILFPPNIVQAFDSNGKSYLASASSGENEAISIYLWRKEQRVNTKVAISIYKEYLRGPLKKLYHIIVWYIIVPISVFFLLLNIVDAAQRNVSDCHI